MNKKIKVFLLIVTLFTMFVSCDILENKTIHIPKMVIQNKVEKKFPITKNFLLYKMALTNPEISFKDDKIYIKTDYVLSSITNKEEGKLNISSNIKYDVEKENLYLVNLSIDEILDKNGKNIIDSSNYQTLKTLIENYVEMSPVYKYGEEYEEKNANSEKKKIKLKNIYIKNGKVYVQT